MSTPYATPPVTPVVPAKSFDQPKPDEKQVTYADAQREADAAALSVTDAENQLKAALQVRALKVFASPPPSMTPNACGSTILHSRLMLTQSTERSRVNRTFHMPPQPPRPCLCPGCPSLTKEAYCSIHKTAWSRLSASKRGYGRKHQRWRLDILSRRPLCEHCLERGLVAIATDIHHLKRLQSHRELQYVEEFVQTLCHACHSRETIAGR
jgi:5-methylcytosine-specific restriction protein A